MSAARIITHRGFKGVLRDNSVVGVLLAIFKDKFCELDVLYVEGAWKLSHDFGAWTPFSADLTDLMAYLAANRHHVRNKIIVDVKWDWVWNKIDDLSVAVGKLKSVLSGCGPLPVWVQACNPDVLGALRQHGFQDHWKLGMIVASTDQWEKHKDQMDYAMVSLHEFKPEDVERMSESCELIGYTCKKPEQLPLYKHLFPFIQGIVCDVSV